ncbi:ImcF-related family protein [Photorhabdus heterorhabditis]|uniref:ImcF-related family protein n=1 Tax=Photorhabdus heterorhabditis TaxID=880156 RepID=UPI0021D36334|nr:ImcF-related family protein [Photorhabdus heterorhabditis]
MKKYMTLFWGIWGLPLVLITLCSLMIWFKPEWLNIQGQPLFEKQLMFQCYVLIASVLFFLIFALITRLFIHDARTAFHYWRRQSEVPKAISASPEPDPILRELTSHLRFRYGYFWRRKVRILMVMGEPEQVEAIAPGLTKQHWLEGESHLLLWGGSLQVPPDTAQLKALRKLRRRRPLDGVVWVMTEEQLSQRSEIDTALRMLEKQGQQLGWQAPLYVWNVQCSRWDQRDRPTQTVGCFLPEEGTPELLTESLNTLPSQLATRGMAQALAEIRHDFLLRLAQSMRDGGVDRLVRQLTPLLNRPSVWLAGVMFSLPLAAQPGMTEHGWLVEASWNGVLDDVRHVRGNAVGFPWEKSAQWGLIVLAVVWGVGSFTSFFANRHQITLSREQVSQARDRQRPLSDRLLSQYGLQREIDRLQYRAEAGAPWYSRFGLNQNTALLKALWPVYQRNNTQLIRDEAAQVLHQRLTEWVNLPPGSPQRRQRLKAAYAQLKAYLMMAQPAKANAVFMSRILMENWPQRAGVNDGLWQNTGESLVRFYAQYLPQHPDWKITADAGLVSEVRRILLTQLGQRSAEETLYQHLLQQVAHSYGDLGLAQMTGATDARRLFSTNKVVPGMFTRQAWEGQVQKAIAEVVASRREEIDWVLSDGRQPIAEAVSPAVLKARLTERYFTDFAGAWLNFLNSVRWNKVHNLSDTIDQLTLMADVRQSPLIALMNTLAYQGETGQQVPGLSDSLVKSARNLFQKANPSVIDPTLDPNSGSPSPLDNTFGPLLTLMGKTRGQTLMTADSTLSLQTYLTRVTRIRLKLQQIANTDDPQERMQALAQTVFQGKSVDLTDTQSYGSLMAASLGAEWSGLGQAVFVQPLTQAWQTVLQPSAASINAQWQASVVADWQAAFNGRYPFVEEQDEASLPVLRQFIQADTGRIEQFLHSQLGGVLHKEGQHWVVDEEGSQGLHVNPAFLTAINQLSALSDVLLTNGGQGMRFELRAKPVRDVAETDLTIDGQRLRYFNQMESWQRLRWPGAGDTPGVVLTWTSVNTGARVFGDYPGEWGLLRWLERAEVKVQAGGRYQLTFNAPDGLPLTWDLRTEQGKGPLVLLGLKGFRLPSQIFSEKGE